MTIRTDKAHKGLALLLTIITVLVTVLAACAPAPTAAPPAPPAAPTNAPAPAEPTKAPAAPAEPTKAPEAKPLDKVTVRLSWSWKAEFAALVLTDDKGFFEEQGIDATLLEGKSSGDAIPQVANGSDTFAYLNLTTAAIGISKDIPVKVVAGLMGKHPTALAYFDSQNIKTPKDMEGHSIALAPGEAFAMIWPAFAKKWDIDITKVTTVQMDSNAKNQAFLDGKIDILPVYVNNELPQLRSKTDKKIDAMIPSELGFSTIANGIITHTDTIKNNPDLVKRFVAAVSKGYAYAVAHPDEALDAVMKRSTAMAQQPRPVLQEQVQLTLDYIFSDATKGHPIGYMADEDWTRTLDILAANKAIATRIPNSQVYTDDFVPAQ